MSYRKTAAEAFIAVGRQLAEAERATQRLPLPKAERQRAARMASAARESVSEAMTSVGRYLEHVSKIGARS